MTSVAKANIAIKVSNIVKASPPFPGLADPPFKDLLGMSYRIIIISHQLIFYEHSFYFCEIMTFVLVFFYEFRLFYEFRQNHPKISKLFAIVKKDVIK